MERNLPATALFSLYNKKGIFGNTDDTLADLEAGLRGHFTDVEVRVRGCVAMFRGRKK